MAAVTRAARVAAVLSCAASAFFFWVWYERYLSIDFNDQGRYYDADAQIVYTDSAFVWCIPAFAFLLLAVGLFAIGVNRRRNGMVAKGLGRSASMPRSKP